MFIISPLLSFAWKGVLCQNIFLTEALVILSKRRALGERKLCDKFPFPILDSSIKIEFLCSNCSCPCFMLVEFRLPSPDVERIYTARYSPFSHYRPHCTLFTPSYPPSPPPQKNCNKHYLRFLLGRLVTSKKKLETMVLQISFLEGGRWGEKQGALWSMWHWRIARKNKYYNCKHDKEIS